MHRFFVLIFLSLTLFPLCLSAQKCRIIDADSVVVEDKSALTVTDYTLHELYHYPVLDANLSIENISGHAITASCVYTISRIDNGEIQICFPGTCEEAFSIGTYTKETTTILKNLEAQLLQAEWMPDTYGECIVTYQYTFIDNETSEQESITFTVTYSYSDSSAILSIHNLSCPSPANPTIIERYDALGRRITTPTKGLNIVKYSDGRVQKIINP